MLIIFFTSISPFCFLFFARREGVVFVCKHEEAPWGFGHAHFSTILFAVPVPLCFFLYKFPPHFCALCNIWCTSCKKNTPESICLRGCTHLFGLFLYLDDLYALVVAAGGAYAVGQLKGAALGAAAHSGSLQLPHIAASFVLSCFRAFSLRYCHLVFPPTLISLLFLSEYQFSSSLRSTSIRGSPLSSRQPHGPSFRFLPQVGHSPLQSSRHR